MTVVINLKKQVDIPVWEWMRFSPQTTAAISCLTCADIPADSRYLYFMSGGLGFYRYDTVSDTYQTLNYPTYSSGINPPLTSVSMRYSSYGGYRGRVLSGTTTTLLIPAIQGKMFVGNTIRIYNGTGSGQQKTIVDVSDTIVYEQGVVTTATVSVLTDTTKRWKWNQWSGYQVSTTYGLGQTQRRKVLYNDATNLYFYDINYQAIDHFNNQGFATGGAYTTPAATAGSQTMYQIEASIITVDTPFNIVPDYTSRFALNTGSIWFFTSLASGGFHALYKYDVAGDYWITRTATASLFPTTTGTDLTMERISNAGGIHLSGTTSGTTIRSLTDYTLNLVTDRYANYQLRTFNGLAGGQRRRIVGNTSNTFYLNRKWDVIPDSGTTYEIWDDLELIYLAGNGSASMFNYSIEADLTAQGPIYDYGVVSNMCLKMNGWEDIAVLTAVRTLNSIKTINPSPVAPGTGYVVGEIITLTTGTGGKVMVESVKPGGLVNTVSLLTVGSNYSVTTFTQGSTTGIGTGLQVGVTAITTTGRITTATGLSHYYKIGDFVTFYGATEALWNSGYTILGVDSLTTLDIEITATATAVAAFSQAVGSIVSSSSNWDVNTMIGRIVCVTTSGPAPTSQIRRITANSGTTLTLQSNITLAVNGTSRFIIYEPYMLGRDKQYKVANKMNTGWANSGSTTTLYDTTKSWYANQWLGYKVRLLTGSGFGSELTILSNTSTMLTFNATQTFIPDATTKYIIMDTFGLCTSLGSGTVLNDTTKNWTVNQWAGKKVKITSGTGVSIEVLITLNSATQLTVASGMGSPDTTSTYTILGIPNRGIGIELIHIFGNSGDTRGRYMYLPRGSVSNAIDRYDIPNETWEYGLTFGPNSETLTTGTMYAYDGDYKIYIQKETGRVMALDVRTNEIENIGTIPYGHSTLLIGNRMEIVETADGLKFLYLMRSNATEMWRMLCWW
jgi:hypothetical protein